jgi:hypothetical protein
VNGQRSKICFIGEIGLLQERVERLEEAGDILDIRADCHCGEYVCNSCRDASSAWRKVKETNP